MHLDVSQGINSVATLFINFFTVVSLAFLQVCCELAAAIGVFAAEMDLEPSSVLRKDMITHATDLIVSVLLKCRHKGAIEAAGLALAKLTR